MNILGTVGNSVGFGLVVALGMTFQDIVGEKPLCESQAPRITASTPTGLFNRCTRKLPDGTILMWDSKVQHQKDLDSGVALNLK